MLRGRFPSRGMSRSSTVEESETVSNRPVRPYTPVYSGATPSNQDVMLKRQGPKLARDRLLDLLRDGKFHSAYELEMVLPQGTWVEGLRGLLALNYAFDTVDNHVRIRFKESKETRQVLVALLSQLDATVSSPEPQVGLETDDSDELGFNPSDDEGGEPTVAEDKVSSGGMVLSEPPEALTLSPANSVSMTAAILAKKNSGKTYLGTVIAEEFMSSSGLPIPLVVIDPTGAWTGLRSLADGQPSQFNILALGGRQGDLPITSKDGSKVADLVNVIRPTPVVIDVSRLAPVEQHEFVADFVERLFTTAERSPIHIIIDEADEFAPQTLNSSSRHQKRSLDAIDRLVRRGRIKGIGVTMITQRSAVLAKNVLSQIDSLWLLNMVEPRDLASVEGWLKHGVTDRQRVECMNQLPKMQPGTAYFLQTGVSPKFRRFKVRRKKTFDSSKTPGLAGYVTPLLAKPPADILALAKSMLKVELSDSEGE